jgi:hypothetical protein
MRHLFFKLRSFLAKIQSELFDDDDNCCDELDFFGELVVTGKGKIKIELNSLSDYKHLSSRKRNALKKRLDCCPTHVSVKFVNDAHHVPCNPIHHDELWWHVKKDWANNWVLTIHWKVTDARTIRWDVTYCE